MNLEEMLLMKAVNHLEEMNMKGNQIRWQIGVMVCLLAIVGMLKSTIAAADHPGIKGVGVEGQASEAVVALLRTAADHLGLNQGVSVAGQEAVPAPPARGGITMATEKEEEEVMMKIRLEKGKQAMVHEEGDSSKSKEEEEVKKEEEEEEKEAKKKEEEEEKKEDEDEDEEKKKKKKRKEGAELTTLRIDVGQANTRTGVITTVSTTSISVVTESDEGRESYNWVYHYTSTRNRTIVISLQNGATGRRRVTWSQTVTIIGDDENTTEAVAEADLPSRYEKANGLSNGEVEVSNVQYAFATNGSGSDGSLANGFMRLWPFP